MNSAELLAQFQQTHTVTHVDIDGHTWSVNSRGSGDHGVLTLPGGGSNGDFGAEILFPVISELEKYARVISVGYPSTINRVSQIVDALPKILDSEGISQATVFGHSAGGQFAQAFMLTHPEYVKALIIVNSAIYKSFRSVVTLKAFSPSFVNLVDPLVKMVMARRFVKRFVSHPDSRFWTDYMDQHMEKLPRGTLANDYTCLEDFANNYTVTLDATSSWGGKILIIESDDDTGFTLKERLYLRTLYRNPNVHVIRKGGHFSFIMRTDEFNKIVKAFILSLAS